MIVEHVKLRLGGVMVLDANNVFDMEFDSVTGTGPFLIGQGVMCMDGYCHGVVGHKTFLSK